MGFAKKEKEFSVCFNRCVNGHLFPVIRHDDDIDFFRRMTAQQLHDTSIEGHILNIWCESAPLSLFTDGILRVEVGNVSLCDPRPQKILNLNRRQCVSVA